jgi:hypothetical protein
MCQLKMGKNLRLLVLAHDGCENGSLERVEGGKIQTKEPEIGRERLLARATMHKARSK